MITNEFNKKCIPNIDNVVLRIVDNAKNVVLDDSGLVLSESSFSNQKLSLCIVEDPGKTGAEKYDLKVGDYVLADRLASFYHTSPVCIMNYDNVIVKTNKDRSEIHPLKNLIFVEKIKAKASDDSGFVLNATDDFLIHYGKIVEINIDDSIDFPFSVGDIVIINRGARESITFNGKQILVYKPENIIAKVLDYE